MVKYFWWIIYLVMIFSNWGKSKKKDRKNNYIIYREWRKEIF